MNRFLNVQAIRGSQSVPFGHEADAQQQLVDCGSSVKQAMRHIRLAQAARSRRCGKLGPLTFDDPDNDK
jgi:hypothetical protein